MKQILLKEEQVKRLTEELAKLVIEFKSNTNVECIYFAPYTHLGNIEGNVINFTIVGNSSIDALHERIKEYNLEHLNQKCLNELGVKIGLSLDTCCHRYTPVAMNPSEVERGKDLYNSKILYDATGKYTEIKNKVEQVSLNKEKDIKIYANLAEFVPPIDKDLDKAIDVQKMESDTQAVKKFTKTKTFEFITNML